jgi:hypothetical protein
VEPALEEVSTVSKEAASRQNMGISGTIVIEDHNATPADLSRLSRDIQ